MLDSWIEKSRENLDEVIRFIAQTVEEDGKVPHFTAESVKEVLRVAEQMAFQFDGKRNALTLRLRELGGLVRIAGDLAVQESEQLVQPNHVTNAEILSRGIDMGNTYSVAYKSHEQASRDDIVKSRTTRRVRVGSEDGRKQDSVRKPMMIKLRVEDVAFHTFSNRIRIKGPILEGPSDFVSTGSYHTINIEPGDTLTIIKEHWPRYILDRLKEAAKAQLNPVSLIVTIEDGDAELFLAADFGIREAVHIRATISRKRGDQKTHDSTMKDFFIDVAIAIRSQLEQAEIGLIVIAGPGFVKDHFRNHLSKAGIKDLPPVVVESINAIGIPGAKEILFRGVIGKMMD